MSEREHNNAASDRTELPLSQRLSPEGQARERRMRGDLLRHVDQTRRRRHGMQAGAGVAALLILAVTARFSIPSTPSPAPIDPVASHHGSPPKPDHPDQTRTASSPPASSFAILSNDPTVLTRLTVQPGPTALVRDLTDDQLLGAFREDGFSVALVRIAGRLELWAN